MAKAVVTGGSGFLGSYISDVLSSRGFSVTVFDRVKSPYLRPDQQMVIGDVLDTDLVERVIDGCQYVFHLAALADLDVARTRPVETVKQNILGTVKLLEAARQASIERFMFASTVYVYSREGGFYRCSKHACEDYIEEYQRLYGVNYTILRYGSLYGPRSDESNGVYRLLMQAATEGKVRYEGGPDDLREYVHAEDAARLSVDALADEFVNQRLVITGHHPTRLSELFTMFSEILGRRLDVTYVEAPDGQQRGHYQITPYSFNPKIGRKLTCNSYVDMGQGLLQVIEHLYHTHALVPRS